MTTQLEQAWELAKQRFAAVGVDVEEALRQLDRLPVSMHCWQGYNMNREVSECATGREIRTSNLFSLKSHQ